MKVNKKAMVRVLCLVIASIMTLSVVGGLAMQVAYMMAA